MKSSSFLAAVMLVVFAGSSTFAQLTELYSTDFTAAEEFVDGGIAGQNGWEGQPDWTVSDTAGSGFLSASGNWQRSRTFNGSLASTDLVEGTQVGITASLNIDGAPFGTNDFFRIGLGGQPEHTGAQTPQVHANFAFDGLGNITAGEALVPYASGDVLELEMIITRGTSALDWGLETTLTNVTQTMTSGPINSTPEDQAGTVTGPSLTLNDYISQGENTVLSFRMLNNADLLTVNLDSLALSLSGVTPVVNADYNGNGLADGPDFLLWQQQNDQIGDLDADGTGDDLLGVPDGDVDEFDLAFWQDNYSPGTLAAAAVPEPSSLVLLLAGLMLTNRRGSSIRMS